MQRQISEVSRNWSSICSANFTMIYKGIKSSDRNTLIYRAVNYPNRTVTIKSYLTNTAKIV